jgi:hypothetical protein
MSFIRPIEQGKRYGLDVAWVKVPLKVSGASGDVGHEFTFDTGCEVTMVSEDVATKLGLPKGGRLVKVSGSTARGSGRLVDVRFRFPPTPIGHSGLQVSSTWVVVAGVTDLALLGFMEVHRNFCVHSHEFAMYFITWSSLRGEHQ